MHELISEECHFQAGRRRPARLFGVLAVAFGVLALCAARAWAAYPDLRGDWAGGVCVGGSLAQCEAHPQYPHAGPVSENLSTGQLSTGDSSNYSLGQINGCTVTWTNYESGGYVAHSVETISADGNSLTGTFSDSNGQSGPDFDHRQSGGPTSCPASNRPDGRCANVSGSDGYAADGPAAYYRLDESSGPTMCDSSTNGLDGPLNSSGLTYDVPGVFTGYSDVGIAADGTPGGIGMSNAGVPGVYGNHSFSLEVWFRWIPTNQHPQPQDQALLALAGPSGAQGPGSVAGLAVWNTAAATYNPGGPTCAAHGSALVLDLYEGFNCWDTTALNVNVYDGGWHQLVVTYDSGSGKVGGYVDGAGLGLQIADNPVELNGAMNGVGPPVRVGSWVDTLVNQPVVGAEDEALVYAGPLNDSRVHSDWQFAKGGHESLPTATQVTCNLDIATGVDTCGAQVTGDGPNPYATSSSLRGTVAFSIVPGSSTHGRFLQRSCALAATPGSLGVSFCSVKFQPASTDTDFPHIRAAYGGETGWDPSSAETAFLHACVAFPPDSPTRDIAGEPLLPDSNGHYPPCDGLPVLDIGYLDPPRPDRVDLSVAYPEPGPCPPGFVRVNGGDCAPSSHRPVRMAATIAAKHKTRTRGGIKVRYRLKGPASVTFWVARVLAGRRGKRGRCVPSPPKSKSKSCKRLVLVGRAFTLASHPGLNSFRFLGWVGHRALPAGEYLLIARPQLQRDVGIPRTMRFRVVKHGTEKKS